MIEDKEKKYIYIALVAIAILLIILLFLIWSPMFTNDNSLKKELQRINLYNVEEYQNEKIEYYKSVVKDVINKENFEKNKVYIDNEYMTKNNLTDENLYNYLVQNNLLTINSNSMVLYNSSVKTDGEKFIYTYKYKNGEKEKLVHIIEEYYEQYSISFEQNSYPIIEKDGYVVEKDGLTIKIIPEASYEKSLLFNIEIVNNSTDEYIFGFNSLNSASITDFNKDEHILSTLILGNETSNINSVPGSTVSFKLSFDISIENQCNLREIKFGEVKKNSSEISSFIVVL